MNTLTHITFKKTAVLMSVVFPIVMFFAIGAFFSGLASINGSNIGKTLVYPVSDETALLIRYLTVYGLLPVFSLALLTSYLNLKLRNTALNYFLVVLLILAIIWIGIGSWALQESYL